MKKNGFTLIELLGTIVILSIVVIIAIPVVDNALKNSREKSYIEQMRNIQAGARNWASEHAFDTPSVAGERVTLTLQQLAQGGYVETNITDPRTGDPLTNVTVVIIYQDNHLEYEVYNKGVKVDL